jgi:hypothetical protein
VDEIRIRWPASYAQEQVLRDFAVNQALLVREGAPEVEVISRKPFTLGESPQHKTSTP